MPLLSQSQTDFYEGNGYLLLENVVPSYILEQARAAIAMFIDGSRSVEASDATYDIGPGHSADSPAVRRLKYTHTLDPVFFDL